MQEIKHISLAYPPSDIVGNNSQVRKVIGTLTDESEIQSCPFSIAIYV
jgi:hypothetical protein